MKRCLEFRAETFLQTKLTYFFGSIRKKKNTKKKKKSAKSRQGAER
jgi:hypothetical protein